LLDRAHRARFGTRPRVPTKNRAQAALGLLLASMAARGAYAQMFSPGRLARPHADFEGLDKCATCHDEQRGKTARCLGCHVELAPELRERTGLHGRMTAEVRDHCDRCHPDHRGVDFQLVSWPGGRAHFDHARTGWPLAARHAELRCEDCHQKRRLVDPDAIKRATAAPARTSFLGLSARCASCHFDEHRGQLGRDCQRCHTDAAWTFLLTPTFDHQRTDFPLRGKHKPLACAECHPQVPDTTTPADAFPAPHARVFSEWKPIAHDSCAACHRDPHEGQLGPRCADCHSEAGWNVIRPSNRLGTSFHDKTRFPLLGRHAEVACKICHGPLPGKKVQYRGLPFAHCADCHTDAHEGQLAARAGIDRPPPDCDACHVVTGFLPPRYELEQHKQTAFPLEGAHQAANCRGCHPIVPDLAARVPAALRARLAKQLRLALFSEAVLHPKRSAELCSDCHRDPHAGQFAKEIARDDCAGCHTTESFARSTFDHDEQSRFPLTGAHRTTPCAGCHTLAQIRPGEPEAIRYKPLDTRCASCHADTHQGQFAAVGRRGRGRDCSFCHPTTAFTSTTFAHDDARFTSFALEGKHAALACAACHRPVEVAPGVKTIRYRPLPRSCEGCHADFHRGAFRGFLP
jgi:hypothetical protein